MTLERAIIIEQDPKAVRAVTFTYRSKRGDSYKTNATLTLLKSWANNVTYTVYYKSSGNAAEHILISVPFCELAKQAWLMRLIAKFSDIPTKCPMIAREYHIIDLELRPTNFPFYLPPGEHYLGNIVKSNQHVLLHARGTIRIKNH